MLQQSYTFATVQFKRSIFFKQFTAVTLLLVLLFVNIIQVAHTHTYKPDATVSIKASVSSNNKEYHTAKAETKCFICEYQLAKDADNVFSSFTVNRPLSFIPITSTAHSFVISDAHTFFETRGPPATA